MMVPDEEENGFILLTIEIDTKNRHNFSAKSI